MRQIAFVLVVAFALALVLSRMTTEIVGTVTKVEGDKVTVYSDHGHFEELTNTWGEHAWSHRWAKSKLAAEQIGQSISVGESYVIKVPLLGGPPKEILAVWKPGWKNWR